MSKIFKSSPETGIKFHLHIHIPNRTRLIDFLRFMWPLLDDNIRPNFQFSVYWPWGTTDTRLEIPTVRPLSRQPSSFKTLKSSSLFLLFCHLLALTQHALPQWSRSCIIECCTSTWWIIQARPFNMKNKSTTFRSFRELFLYHLGKFCSKGYLNVDGFIGNKSRQSDNTSIHSANMIQTLNLWFLQVVFFFFITPYDFI